jgi:hypothetical protein
MLGYIVDNQVLILLNAGRSANSFEDVLLPEGNWKLIGTIDAIDHKQGVEGPKRLKQLVGGRKISVDMDATSLYIWKKD